MSQDSKDLRPERITIRLNTEDIVVLQVEDLERLEKLFHTARTADPSLAFFRQDTLNGNDFSIVFHDRVEEMIHGRSVDREIVKP